MYVSTVDVEELLVLKFKFKSLSELRVAGPRGLRGNGSVNQGPSQRVLRLSGYELVIWELHATRSPAHPCNALKK